MSGLRFDADVARVQRAAAQCHDLVIRRSMVLAALNLHTGERVLELGCGGGFFAHEAAKFVGATGQVCAIDISTDQIAAARERCAEFAWVDCRVAGALDLPWGDGEFDAVYGVQVFEYIADLDQALREARRVLRPGGRLVNLATNWTSVVWHSEHPERMRRMLAAFMDHAPYPDLPATLAARLRRSGLQTLRQTPMPILNMSYNENGFSYWLARLVRGFSAGRQSITEEEANVWLQEFEELEKQGAYFFCSTPILTEAVRLS